MYMTVLRSGRLQKRKLDWRGPAELAATLAPIRERLNAGSSHNYLCDFVYGDIDRVVTSFGVVSAVAGAVIVMGMANLVSW
jgi:hypothetical protein